MPSNANFLVRLQTKMCLARVAPASATADDEINTDGRRVEQLDGTETEQCVR
jgi:hypothetical protein